MLEKTYFTTIQEHNYDKDLAKSSINILILYTKFIIKLFCSMLKIIRNFFFSKNPNIYWFQTLVLLGIAMVLVLLYKRQNLSPFYEGFTQDAPFVSKYDQDIYDDFYVQIYDRLFLSDKMGVHIADKFIEMTQPAPNKSVFLDIGSGTGHVVSHLQKNGYTAYGVDKSMAMVKHSSDKFPDIHIKQGDAMEPMIFEGW